MRVCDNIYSLVNVIRHFQQKIAFSLCYTLIFHQNVQRWVYHALLYNGCLNRKDWLNHLSHFFVNRCSRAQWVGLGHSWTPRRQCRFLRRFTTVHFFACYDINCCGYAWRSFPFSSLAVAMMHSVSWPALLSLVLKTLVWYLLLKSRTLAMNFKWGGLSGVAEKGNCSPPFSSYSVLLQKTLGERCRR